MWIRDITRFDYAAVDRLLLQLQQADAAGRPDLARRSLYEPGSL